MDGALAYRSGRLIEENILGLHRFYHWDRFNTLTEGQEISLDERGLSRFGSVYWDAISTKSFDLMSDTEQREYLLEEIKRDARFSAYPSRMQVFFGANTIEDVKRFAEKVEPKPAEKSPVYEVFSSRFWTLDMNWLDYNSGHDKRVGYLRDYWYAAISNHNPIDGEQRRPPLLEVLMTLPVTVGKIVDWV